MRKKEMYSRLRKGEAMGFKIATRKTINPDLTDFEAYDTERFLIGLEHLFGKGDKVGDARISYSISDNEKHIEFEAFVGSSGPSYGGTVHHYLNIDTLTLKEDVISALADFDKFLEILIKESRD